QADAFIWESGGRGIDGRPEIRLGLKGICYVELRAKGARHDWHSSVATTVPNPAWRLVWALRSLKNIDERVQIPGFYDSVIGPTERELEVLVDIPNTEEARLKNLGIDQFLGGRTGVELAAWDYFQPTCTISGFESGYHEAGMKTVLPATATAKLDMRLVANQDPFIIYDLLRKHLDDNGFADIETEPLAQQYPARTRLDAPIAEVVADSYRAVYEQEPVFIPTSLGSGPLYQLCAQFGIDAAPSGAGNARSQAHAPNENIYVDDFILAIKHVTQIIERFAAREEI
ncbi:MAG TPA: M20/M25/M40 family metallo-hydrolase, partial [Thermomicrobiales bacterium]|nr:M20/M25/M40 family metallo-hydrolase [Thermomicrobiales bacterium]